MNAESKLEQAAILAILGENLDPYLSPSGEPCIDGLFDCAKKLIEYWQSITTPASNDWKAKFHEWLSGRLDIPIPEMDLIISYVERYIAPSKPHTVEEGQTQEPVGIDVEKEMIDALTWALNTLDYHNERELGQDVGIETQSQYARQVLAGYSASLPQSSTEESQSGEGDTVGDFLQELQFQPYPEDIFPPISKEDLAKIHLLLKKEMKMPLDRLTGHIGRELRKPIIESAIKVSNLYKQSNK